MTDCIKTGHMNLITKCKDCEMVINETNYKDHGVVAYITHSKQRWIKITIETEFPAGSPFLLCRAYESGSREYYEGHTTFDFYDIDDGTKSVLYYIPLPKFPK